MFAGVYTPIADKPGGGLHPPLDSDESDSGSDSGCASLNLRAFATPPHTTDRWLMAASHMQAIGSTTAWSNILLRRPCCVHLPFAAAVLLTCSFDVPDVSKHLLPSLLFDKGRGCCPFHEPSVKRDADEEDVDVSQSDSEAEEPAKSAPAVCLLSCGLPDYLTQAVLRPPATSPCSAAPFKVALLQFLSKIHPCYTSLLDVPLCFCLGSLPPSARL